MLGAAEFRVKACFGPCQNNGQSLMMICSNHHGNELISKPHHRPDWKIDRQTNLVFYGILCVCVRACVCVCVCARARVFFFFHSTPFLHHMTFLHKYKVIRNYFWVLTTCHFGTNSIIVLMFVESQRVHI